MKHLFSLLLTLFLFLLTCTSAIAQTRSTTSSNKRVVAYLPYYKGADLTDAVAAVNWTGITDLDLAFINPPACTGPCTASSDMTFGAKGHTDVELDALVSLMHRKGIRVLASIGGAGGDQQILQFYNAGLSTPLIASLNKFVGQHKLDGVDVDIEAPDNMGAPFADFIDKLVKVMRPQGKLVTAAVAKYLQIAMPDAALHQFDYINLMVYSNLKDATDILNFYANVKHVPREQLVLGVPFFAESANSKFADYNSLLAAYPNAWRVDTVGGGMLDDGVVMNYTGEATLAKEVQLAKQYGGVMIWHILGDAPAPHSLLDIVRTNLR